MPGFREEQSDYASHPIGLVGQRRRVGGIGQTYTIKSLLDPGSVLIHTDATNSDMTYPVTEALRDTLADDPLRPDPCRYAKLVGQYRSIGPDGPEYEVVSIDSATKASIWIVGNEENDTYDIEDILLDPVVFDRNE